MGRKIFLIIVIFVIIAAVYILFVWGWGAKVGLINGNAEIIGVTYDEMTPEEFKVDCEQDGGEYRETIFYGVGPIYRTECGYIKAPDGNRLCYSSDREEKVLSDCMLCKFGYTCGQAAGDFGPTHCRCAEYKTLYRMTLE